MSKCSDFFMQFFLPGSNAMELASFKLIPSYQVFQQNKIIEEKVLKRDKRTTNCH